MVKSLSAYAMGVHAAKPLSTSTPRRRFYMGKVQRLSLGRKATTGVRRKCMAWVKIP